MFAEHLWGWHRPILPFPSLPFGEAGYFTPFFIWGLALCGSGDSM